MTKRRRFTQTAILLALGISCSTSRPRPAYVSPKAHLAVGDAEKLVFLPTRVEFEIDGKRVTGDEVKEGALAMTELRQIFEDWTGLSPEAQDRLVSSVLIVLVLCLVRLVSLRIMRRRVDDVAQQYRWRSGITYTTTILALLMVARVWLPGFESLATFAGLIGAGLAVAMHETISNLTGWAFILWRRPFQVGDRIEIAGSRGDVIDIRLFQFSLLEIGNWVDAEQSTGRIMHVPNGLVLKERLANYTKGFEYIWSEIPVLLTFESDWKKAKQIITEVAKDVKLEVPRDAERQIRQTAQEYMIFYGALTPIVYTSVRESGVLLTLRYMSQPRRVRSNEQMIWEEILERFAAEDSIDFAYPTMRRYDNRLEGKPRAGGPSSSDIGAS